MIISFVCSCSASAIKSLLLTKMKYVCGENPQKVHTGVFSLSWSITRCCFLGWATWQNRDCKYLEEIKIAFIFAEQSFFSTFTKISRLTSEDIQGWNKHPKGITWRNDFRSQFVIVIFNTKSKLEKNSHVKPLHCDQFANKINIRLFKLISDAFIYYFWINVADEIVSDGMVVGEVKQEQFFNIDGFLSQAFTAAFKYQGLKIYFLKRKKSPKSSCYGKLS